jgi:hypothetical protein
MECIFASHDAGRWRPEHDPTWRGTYLVGTLRPTKGPSPRCYGATVTMSNGWFGVVHALQWMVHDVYFVPPSSDNQYYSTKPRERDMVYLVVFS